MTKPMRFDFISDVSCPWCIIGLQGLQEALTRVGPLVSPEIHFHPFELNPDMPPEGQALGEHVAEKYGVTLEQSKANRDAIRERAAALGFAINFKSDGRIYNTFDAHRLLHWAALEGHQAALKHALFTAYFTDGLDPSDHEVLVGAAQKAGLDARAARELLTSGAYATEVRQEEAYWRREGISAVPAVIVNSRYMILGGQPPEAFERAIRSIAAESSGEPDA